MFFVENLQFFYPSYFFNLRRRPLPPFRLLNFTENAASCYVVNRRELGDQRQCTATASDDNKDNDCDNDDNDDEGQVKERGEDTSREGKRRVLRARQTTSASSGDHQPVGQGVHHSTHHQLLEDESCLS